MEIKNLRSLSAPDDVNRWFGALLRQIAVDQNLHESVYITYYGDLEDFDLIKHVETILPDHELIHRNALMRGLNSPDDLLFVDDEDDELATEEPDGEIELTTVIAAHLWNGPGCVIGAKVTHEHEVDFTIVATEYDTAVELARKLGEGLPPMPQVEVEEDQVQMNLWMWSAAHNAPIPITQLFKVPTWEEIGGNYPASIHDRVERVMQFNSDDFEAGRVILFHGPPGTGKTTAIRALAKEWSNWASCQYITDAEEFFANPQYIMRLTLNMQGGHNVLIVEDCGEFITEDGTNRHQQSLARLLNLADGILGQNLNVSIVMTTNEPMEALHPALSRPGRCAASIMFPNFTTEESVQWLNDHGILANDTGESSLAELFAVVREANAV